MNVTEKVSNVNMERTRVVLLDNGYISANYLYRCNPDKLREEFGIEINYLPTPKDLREMADDPDAPFDSYCLIFENGKKSYWYKVDSLIKTFMQPLAKSIEAEIDSYVIEKRNALIVMIGVIITTAALVVLLWNLF